MSDRSGREMYFSRPDLEGTLTIRKLLGGKNIRRIL